MVSDTPGVKEVLQLTQKKQRLLNVTVQGLEYVHPAVAAAVDIVDKLDDLGRLGDRDPQKVLFKAWELMWQAGQGDRNVPIDEPQMDLTRSEVGQYVETARMVTPEGWAEEMAQEKLEEL